MPTNYSGRLTAILVVLLISILGVPGIGPGISSWSSVLRLHPQLYLKPGIDIAGGTSLTYEIKKPPGFVAGGSETLAEQVARSLKKRVDPDGVKNLVWRPQGNDRLEIQLPRSGASGEKEKAQRAFSKATDDVKATNISSAEVLRAIDKLSGEARDKRLAELANGSKVRADLYKQLVDLHEEIARQKAASAAAAAKKDAQAQFAADDAQAVASIKFDQLSAAIESTNLFPQVLQTTLENITARQAAVEDAKNKNGDVNAAGAQLAEAQQQLTDLKKKSEGFPAQVSAIDQYQTAYTNFQKFKDSLDDATDLKRLLRGSGVLEFHVLVTDTSSPVVTEMIRRLKEKGPVGEANDEMRWFSVDPERAGEFRSGVAQTYNGRTYVLASITKDKSLTHGRDTPEWALEDASVQSESNGTRAVGFNFDVQGGVLFGELTAKCKGEQLAIVLDDKIISAPTIQTQIGRTGQITGGGKGGFTNAELEYLVRTLNAGSLPAQLADEPISERSITPQLGADNLSAGLLASGIGLVVVAIFLIGYYYLSGLVAFFAVLMNLLIILGVLAMFGATFTLPSIAGIVLTVGTAVDANVLIFERLREEQHRGLALKPALRNAYDRAFSAIIDSNMTTAITSACLYAFGSEEVRGFGLTLLIGIISSMFTALFVTKTLFAVLIDKFGVRELHSLPVTFPRWDRMLKPNIDWMKYIWPFIIFSVIFIAVGLSAFVIRQREMFDIEFASGTSVEFELKENVPLAQVRDILGTRPHELPSASIVGINGREDLYQLVTPNQNATQVKEAVVSALGTRLKVQLPSKFDQSGQTVEQARGTTVLPIEKDSLQIDDKPVESISKHLNGVAVVLRNLDPPISPNEIRERIQRASFQTAQLGPNVNLSRWDTSVDRLDDDRSPDAANHPAKLVVVSVSDPSFPYNKSARDWTENLANPVWRLINDGVGREATLRNVASFNPQVAASVQYKALMATCVSIAVIMIYIWFRFGNLKYGTATVVALVHDTLAVVGAIGMTHFIGGTAVGKMFLIYEPFRLNLTLVAAVLTIMGYSMIDTIVVFDRIRENRGKYGHISRKVINDSINQTLSRTLLTAGTTLIMVGVMYICGGPGVHGFTFVLLVGILIGTYSSIAVAAPLLLLGKATGGADDDLRGRRSSTGQGSTGQGSTGQGSTGQGSTGQGSTGQGSRVSAELGVAGNQVVGRDER